MPISSPMGLPSPVDAFPGIDLCGSGCKISPNVTVFRTINRHESAGIFLGDEVLLLDNIRLLLGEDNTQLKIGHRVVVNVGGYLSGEGGLTIADDVIIGPHVRLLSAGHGIHGGQPEVWKNPLIAAPIHIGKGAWLGAGVTVLQGVNIGQGAVVGAASVVTRDVPPFAVVVGNPARVMHYRRGVSAKVTWWQRLRRYLSGRLD